MFNKDSYQQYLQITDDKPAAAVLALADAIDALTREVTRLGNNDAATPMGAIEALGVVIREESDLTRGLLSSIADDIAGR